MTEITGTCSGQELEKRFYLPGLMLEGECPSCAKAWTHDFAKYYLSYPVVGAPEVVHVSCAECAHEWEVRVIVRVTLELAEAGLVDPCDHDKLYSGEANQTTVPMWFWVCRKCDVVGRDRLAQRPPQDRDAFAARMRVLFPDDPFWA